ncbi:MAG: family N-acetyltransferase, partial [Actinobacteria bacterium]|nr:family N-acetyltransferase [Actinomycetota bacterium]
WRVSKARSVTSCGASAAASKQSAGRPGCWRRAAPGCRRSLPCTAPPPGPRAASLDLLAGADGAPVAAALGFQDEEAYYLYNSAYDPAAAGASPGVVLVDLLVERAAEDALGRFDFLKGDEAYKLRLGGRPRPLFVVEGPQ